MVRLFNEAIKTHDLSVESFIKAFNSCAWFSPSDLPEMRKYFSSHAWMLDTHVFNSMMETYRYTLL